MEDVLWIKEIVDSTPTPPFLTNSKVDMINFMDFHKVLLEGVHFQPFQAHEMELNWKVG
jgi:hypothetical protein